jgi:hypothetical protein
VRRVFLALWATSVVVACSSGTAPVSSVASPPASSRLGVNTSVRVAPSESAISGSALAADGSPIVGVKIQLVGEVPPIPTGFIPGGAVVEVHAPDGLLSEPVSLRLGGGTPPTGTVPVLLHRNDAGGWEAVPAEFSGGVYSAQVMSFSWYWPGWLTRIDDWSIEAVDSGFDWLTGRTDPPQPCETAGYEWVTSSGAPPDGAFHVCISPNPRPDGTERVEVKIKSNRAFAMWVVVPRLEADYVWIEDSGGDIIEELLSNLATGSNDRVLLGPGRTLSVGYLRPQVGGASQQFFAYQDTVTQLATLLQRNVGGLLGSVGTLLAVIECFDDGVKGLAAMNWSRAVTCFEATIGASENRVELALDAAIASGRASLAAGTRDRFVAEVLRSERLSTTLGALKKLSGIIAAGRFAADGVILANDAALGLVDGAGALTVTLRHSAPQPAATPGTCADAAEAMRVYVEANGLNPDWSTSGVCDPPWAGYSQALGPSSLTLYTLQFANGSWTIHDIGFAAARASLETLGAPESFITAFIGAEAGTWRTADDASLELTAQFNRDRFELLPASISSVLPKGRTWVPSPCHQSAHYYWECEWTSSSNGLLVVTLASGSQGFSIDSATSSG